MNGPIGGLRGRRPSALLTITGALWFAFASTGATAQDESEARDASPRNIEQWAAAIQANYPPMALRNDEEGTVAMRITVGVDGRVSDCAVTTSSGSEALDEGACEGMRDFALYEPARNEAGEPVPTTTLQAIRYVLPDGGSLPEFALPRPINEEAWRANAFDDEFTSALSTTTLRRAMFVVLVSEEGDTSGCGMLISSGSAEVDRDGCARLLEHARFEPAILEDGSTIPGAYPVTVPEQIRLQ